MATIADIREKFPQYADIPDQALVDAFHSKYYSDLPKEDFYTIVNFTPEPSIQARQPYPGEIPGGPKFVKEEIPTRKSTLGDYAAAIPEMAMTGVTGAITSAVAPYAAIGREVLSGKLGTPEGRRLGMETANAVMGATYKPKTAPAQAGMERIGSALEGVDLNAIPFAQGAVAGAMAPAALRQVTTGLKNEAGYLKNAVTEIPAVRQYIDKTDAANLAKSYENASKIDAANLARKHGILLNPDISNPTTGSRVRGVVIGDSNINASMAKANEPKWTNIVKSDLGITPDKKLDIDSLNNVRSSKEISGPYDQVRGIKSITIDPQTINKLDDLKVAPLFGDTGQAAKTNEMLLNLKTQLQEGGSGEKLLKSIQQIRQDAQRVLAADNANNPISPAARMQAKAQLSAAKVMEEMIDDSLPNIRARDSWVKARTKMAQTYDVESALDFATNKIDPKKLAAMASEGKPLSGVVGEIAQIAANYPEIAGISNVQGSGAVARITRTTLPGIAGAVIGAPFGGVGSAIGAGLGEMARRGLAKNMLSEGFQAKNVVPRDYRPTPVVNNLRPVTPGQANIVPFDPRNALVGQEIRPNWVFGQPDLYPQPAMPSGPAQLPAPNPASTIATIRAEEARRARMARMAEAEGIQAERNAPRTPTGEGMLFDLDPVSGKLVPSSQGIKGATPETFQDYTATLRSATNKISSGQNFALSAAEKVAWDKTRVDLAEVMPGFKALDEKAIANKMMDRQWVQDAVTKARDKAAAFEEIMKRSKDAEAVNAARASRERMMDVAEMLQDSLDKLRPDNSRKQQGPKTRNAIRNNLIEQRNINELSK